MIKYPNWATDKQKKCIDQLETYLEYSNTNLEYFNDSATEFSFVARAHERDSDTFVFFELDFGYTKLYSYKTELEPEWEFVFSDECGAIISAHLFWVEMQRETVKQFYTQLRETQLEIGATGEATKKVGLSKVVESTRGDLKKGAGVYELSKSEGYFSAAGMLSRQEFPSLGRDVSTVLGQLGYSYRSIDDLKIYKNAAEKWVIDGCKEGIVILPMTLGLDNKYEAVTCALKYINRR